MKRQRMQRKVCLTFTVILSLLLELLEAGTPIHVVTRMMRHGDSKVTLEHYAHVVGDAERVASERLSHKIEAQLESEPEMESASIKTA